MSEINNRLPFNTDGAGMQKPMTEEQKKQAIISAIGQLGTQLFSYIAPGMTIAIKIPKPKIIVPGVPAESGLLFISRPAGIVDIQVNINRG
jgi:hypothetical protein